MNNKLIVNILIIIILISCSYSYEKEYCMYSVNFVAPKGVGESAIVVKFRYVDEIHSLFSKRKELYFIANDSILVKNFDYISGLYKSGIDTVSVNMTLPLKLWDKSEVVENYIDTKDLKLIMVTKQDTIIFKMCR